MLQAQPNTTIPIADEVERKDGGKEAYKFLSCLFSIDATNYGYEGFELLTAVVVNVSIF
jgi:hypothetical protein